MDVSISSLPTEVKNKTTLADQGGGAGSRGACLDAGEVRRGTYILKLNKSHQRNPAPPTRGRAFRTSLPTTCFLSSFPIRVILTTMPIILHIMAKGNNSRRIMANVEYVRYRSQSRNIQNVTQYNKAISPSKHCTIVSPSFGNRTTGWHSHQADAEKDLC